MTQTDMKILRDVEPLWDDCSTASEFEFLHEDDFENTVLPYLRCNTPECHKRRLTRNILKSRWGVYDDGIKTLDEYYIDLINDTLLSIRHGETAYIFNLEQVQEILRFEPEAQFVLHDGIYYVNLFK